MFEPIRLCLARAGVNDAGLRAVVTRVSHGAGAQAEVLRLKEDVDASGPDSPPLFERYALLQTAQWAAGGVPALPVPEGVKQLLLDEFIWLTEPKERELHWFRAGEYVFSALCKLATFRRFPAGQLHWEVAGLPRSTLWRVRWREFPLLLRGIRDLGGFRPTFMPHLAWRRRQIVLSEREHYRSLHLIAQALVLQPHIRGFVGEAWFYSPDATHVSPHLAWAPRFFRDWGAVVVRSGPAGRESGVFENSRTRQRLAEEGAIRPTLGLVVWPRAAMLRWSGQQTSAAD